MMNNGVAIVSVSVGGCVCVCGWMFMVGCVLKGMCVRVCAKGLLVV